MKVSNSRWATDQYSISGDRGIAMALGVVDASYAVSLIGSCYGPDPEAGNGGDILIAQQKGWWESLGYTDDITINVSTDDDNYENGWDTIEVTYLDTDWDLQTTTLVVDGSGNATGPDAKRFLSAKAINSGGAGGDPSLGMWTVDDQNSFTLAQTNAGLFTLDGDSVGGDRTGGLFYSIPRSHRGMVLNCRVQGRTDVSFNAVARILSARDAATSGGALDLIAELSFSNLKPAEIKFDIPRVIEGQGDVFVVIHEISAANIYITGSMDLIVVND